MTDGLDRQSDSGKVGFAVVGLGLMGKRHCKFISCLDEARVVAVCDREAAVVSKVAAEYDAQAFTEFDAMIAVPGVDAVVICLPSSLHAEFGIRAARAGKHVVVEKPIDSQSSQARQLIEACREAGVVCAVISQNRYSPGLASLKLAIESGLMGTPVLARATVKWFRHDEYYTESRWRGRRDGEHGGVLMNQAVHSIDTLQWLFGVPRHVSGYTHCSRSGVLQTEDSAVAIFKWDSGLVATLEASTHAAPGFDEAYEIHSPVASMKVEKGQVAYWYQRDGLPAPEPLLRPVSQDADLKTAMFTRQYTNIVRTISGVDSLEVRPEEALAVVQTIEKIYANADC